MMRALYRIQVVEKFLFYFFYNFYSYFDNQPTINEYCVSIEFIFREFEENRNLYSRCIQQEHDDESISQQFHCGINDLVFY